MADRDTEPNEDNGYQDDGTVLLLKVFGYSTPVVILLALFVGYSFL